MANIIANVAYGRAVQWIDNVEANTPTGAAILILAFTGTETDENLRDADHLTAVLATALDESTQTGYARKVLVAADLSGYTTNDTSNRNEFTLPAQSWTLTATGTAWTRIGAFYRPAAAPADTAILPIGFWDYPTTGATGTETITFPNPVFTAGPPA